MRRSVHENTPANRISKGMISAGVSRGVSPGTEGAKGMVSVAVRRGKSNADAIAKGKPSAVRRAKGGPLGYLGVGDPAGLDRLELSRKRNEELNTPHYKKGGKLWIKDATKNKGSLHRSLHIPAGQKIPLSKIEKAEHSSNPKLRKKARLAETLRGFHHKSSRGR